jgi:proline racemase
MVGALVQRPTLDDCVAGVIFFNNAGYLGMCGHGLVGMVEALAFLGRIDPGEHRFETPVGAVSARLREDGSVTFWNVESYRWKAGVAVRLPDGEIIRGDVAYGGNWFFLTEVSDLSRHDIGGLVRRCQGIRSSLEQQGIRGAGGAEIDHVELYMHLQDRSEADCRNFVLCPGGEYDRSPCGTGTSAKLACLAADGHLAPGQLWRQQSIIGSLFEGRYQRSSGGVLPEITGRAFVTAEAKCVLDERDPFRHGIRNRG